MAADLSIHDEVIGVQAREAQFTLWLASEHVTAREIIDRRVREEVAAYNANRTEHFHGLVQPAESEREAFGRNGFLVLVNDREVESLDEPLVIGERAEVTFIELVPLAGG